MTELSEEEERRKYQGKIRFERAFDNGRDAIRKALSVSRRRKWHSEDEDVIGFFSLQKMGYRYGERCLVDAKQSDFEACRECGAVVEKRRRDAHLIRHEELDHLKLTVRLLHDELYNAMTIIREHVYKDKGEN